MKDTKMRRTIRKRKAAMILTNSAIIARLLGTQEKDASSSLDIQIGTKTETISIIVEDVAIGAEVEVEEGSQDKHT